MSLNIKGHNTFMFLQWISRAIVFLKHHITSHFVHLRLIRIRRGHSSSLSKFLGLSFLSLDQLHRTRIDSLPNELLLELFSYLPLKSLVAAQGVSRRWRQLVPCSKISPARRDLFQFYLKIVHSPHFELTRPWVMANLRPFDRHAFVEGLMEQYHYLPEIFRIWILEWPARAVIGCVWPGLPAEYCALRTVVGVERMKGWNWLAQMPPTVSTVRLQHERSQEYLPGLLIWSWGSDDYVWLILNERESLRDRVYCVEEDDVIRGEDGTEFDLIYGGWLEWLEHKWEEIEWVCDELTESNRDKYYCDADRAHEVPPSGPWRFAWGERPAVPWSKRHELLSL